MIEALVHIDRFRMDFGSIADIKRVPLESVPASRAR